jgi:predicted Zn-ribbon and HTH transcriptional regulator
LRKISAKTQTNARDLLEFVKNHLTNSGGARRDDLLVREVAGHFYKQKLQRDTSAKIRFVFFAAKFPLYHKEDENFYDFWYLNDEAKKKLLEFIAEAEAFFKAKEKSDLVDQNYLAAAENLALCSFFSISKKFGVNVFGDVGLRSSPEIEPKTIRDKIYLVLKKKDTPLHFSEIAKLIGVLGLDQKPAHIQTVHNELIKDDRFVLVGRGIYALRERGFEPGTVREVIARILKKNGPLRPEQVVKLVGEQRLLKENTILLGLQDRRFFRKLDDGRYHVREA